MVHLTVQGSSTSLLEKSRMVKLSAATTGYKFTMKSARENWITGVSSSAFVTHVGTLSHSSSLGAEVIMLLMDVRQIACTLLLWCLIGWESAKPSVGTWSGQVLNLKLHYTRWHSFQVLTLARALESPFVFKLFPGPNSRHRCSFDGIQLTIVCHEIGRGNVGTCYPELWCKCVQQEIL